MSWSPSWSPYPLDPLDPLLNADLQDCHEAVSSKSSSSCHENGTLFPWAEKPHFWHMWDVDTKIYVYDLCVCASGSKMFQIYGPGIAIFETSAPGPWTSLLAHAKLFHEAPALPIFVALWKGAGAKHIPRDLCGFQDTIEASLVSKGFGTLPGSTW
jgi:hypothetical protein